MCVYACVCACVFGVCVCARAFVRLRECLTRHLSDSFSQKSAACAVWRADNVEVWLQ